jgi:hypothetical protein
VPRRELEIDLDVVVITMQPSDKEAREKAKNEETGSKRNTSFRVDIV